MLKLFGFSNKSSKNLQQSLVPTPDDDQIYNPFTRIAVYSHHTNIIRHLILLNKTRLASAGDDTLVLIWDIQTGERLHVLSAHSRPITCLSVLPTDEATCPDGAISDLANSHHDCLLLLSAASDKLICIWEACTGSLLNRLTDHQSTARCFLKIPEFRCFASGGEKLCLWKSDGKLITAVERQDEEDITQIMQLKGGRLVVTVDKRPVVYDICATGNRIRLLLNRRLTPHREAITCLLNINNACFVSGSLDGTIILWSSQALAPSRYFNSITDYLGDNRVLPYSIQDMICLDEHYLVCAIGTGFCIYDIVQGCALIQKKHAHYSKILSLTVVHNGTLLATVSEDGSIRLWGCRKLFAQPQQMKLATPALEKLLGCRISDVRGSKDNVQTLDLIGECLGHSGAIRVCLDAGSSGMLTCGADGLIINWKDGTYECMKENALLQDLYKTLN